MGSKRKTAVLTSKLLADFAKLLNAVGPDDVRVDAFLEKHKANEELVPLARIARALKKALAPRS